MVAQTCSGGDPHPQNHMGLLSCRHKELCDNLKALYIHLCQTYGYQILEVCDVLGHKAKTFTVSFLFIKLSYLL